jgi:hypothetical protein
LPIDWSGTHASRHEMILEETRPSGDEVWSCPECGRRSVMRWLPDYERIVLEPGDERVIHVGGTGGVRTGKVELVADVALPSSDEDWTRWLHDHGIKGDGPAGPVG